MSRTRTATSNRHGPAVALTPQDVRDVLFDKPPLGRRGYAEDEVDAFLDLVERALAGHRPMSADDVAGVVFSQASVFRRGYDENQVDAFLDQVGAELAARAGSPAEPGP